jgi:hypothetical protein
VEEGVGPLQVRRRAQQPRHGSPAGGAGLRVLLAGAEEDLPDLAAGAALEVVPA